MRRVVTDGIACWSVCHDREPCKNDWTDRDVIWYVDLSGPRNHVLDGVNIPMQRGNFEEKMGGPLYSTGTLCRELCKNGWSDRDAIWRAHTCGLDKPCRPTRCGCKLSPPGEYNWSVCVLCQCSLISNTLTTLLLYCSLKLTLCFLCAF